MEAIETFYKAAGVTLFLLGALHCVLPRSFRLGVILMLLGDGCFALAIAFPKKVLQLLTAAGVSMHNFPSDLTLAGIVFALLLTALFYFIFMRFFRMRPVWQRAAAPQEKEEETAGSAPVSSNQKAACADPKLFAGVKLQSPHKRN